MNSVEIELVLNSKICNHFTVCKQIINEIISLGFQLLKPFNCVERIAILVYKWIGSKSFKNEITYKLHEQTSDWC